MSRLACLLLPFALAACAHAPVAALLLGEQHDAPAHQQHHRETIASLAARGQLAGVVVEMAQGGRSTRRLSPAATEQQVREALAWNDEAWPWAHYGPAVMAAVRAGVPVFGSNLDMAQMRAAMADERLDRLLPESALRVQRDAIRQGHCDMLPEARLPGMVRVQIARDQAMARAVESAAVAGKTVVLLAGSGHVDPAVGVPLHLAGRARARSVMLPRVDTGRDYCAELRNAREKPPA